jgi:adenine-specific DNA-methyltransferase
MEKLKMQTESKVDKNIEALGKLFPNTLTEVIKGYDAQQKPIIEQAIDFDLLKQELSNVVVEGYEERYQMNWPDKKKSMLLANSPIDKTLRPCKKESVDFDTTENLYIEGDNLDVLKLLQETYLNKVKMIYIDPPYNTGGDSFVYNDNFNMHSDDFSDVSGQHDEDGNMLFDVRQNNESNGRFHTDWLNMIYPRLKLAKDLLTDDGAIFISIDDNEIDNLKKVCDEIFGKSNFIAQFPWQSRQSIQNDTDISSSHEYVVAYAKIRRKENRRLKEINASTWFKTKSFVCLPLPLDKEKFDNPDNDLRGLWKSDPFDAPNIRPNLTYVIKNPNTGEEYLPPNGRHWRTEQKSYEKLLKDNRIIFGKTGTSRPQLKVFYEEKKMFGSIDNTWWTGEKCGTSTQGTKEQIQIFNGFAPFDTPKPVKLLKKILSLVSLPDNNDIVLDFFSGSATTAHAVMELNDEDGGNRKFIMVQIPEETDKYGYKNICEIGKARICRAGIKIKEENPEKTANLDTGFRVLKLDSTNMKEVFYKPIEYIQIALDGFAENIKEDRSAEDLLFQVMLELGELLSSDIEEKIIAGKKVFNVGGRNIIACFDTKITNEVVIEIAKLKPFYAVFRDNSMDNDSVATNFEQIFETYSPTTIRKVL